LTRVRRYPRPFLSILAACIVLPAAAAPYPNSGSFGVPFSKDEAWYRECMRVEKQSPPKPAASAPAGCNAGDLYYRKRSQALTAQAEWDGVRACAVAQDDHGVLMMLYANGFGVPRNTDSAIHQACQLDAAKAEMAGRIAHLANLPANAVFDQCDDITSGRMGTVCAAIRGAQDGRNRGARLERMEATLPATARAAFQRLQAAAGRYALAAGAETDMQGTAAPSFAIQRAEKMREQFMQAVLDAASGKLPAASPQDAAARDRELNTVYRALMAAPSPQQDWPDRLGATTIERKDVRAAERAWIAYRDAFTAFAAQLNADANAVQSLLTGQRIAALRDTARGL
jgi:uncharacterized protein YecT (DUF1311 family)